MKKALAILLLSCFAAYHFGYYAFYFSLEYHMENEWEETIYGAQSAGLEEYVMEVPLSAPYMANQDEFQATNTRFEKNGKYFRAIKQRYQNDTLQVVYVQDTARKSLDNTVKKWIAFLTEDEIPTEKGAGFSLKLMVKDYIQPDMQVIELAQGSSFEITTGFIFSAYASPFFQLDSPPPQLG